MDEIINEALCGELNEIFKRKNDPAGSYTGNNIICPDSEPEQDADDL